MTCYAHPGDIERLLKDRFPADANEDAVIVWLGEHFRAAPEGRIQTACKAGSCVFASPEGCTAGLGGCGGQVPPAGNQGYEKLHTVLAMAKLFG